MGDEQGHVQSTFIPDIDDKKNPIFKVNPQPLYDLGVDETTVAPEMIEDLVTDVWDLKNLQNAWKEFTGYTDPPCPAFRSLKELIEFTKTLVPLP